MGKEIQSKLQKVMRITGIDAPEQKLMPVILSISRTLDKRITDTINDYKKIHNIKLSALEKDKIKNELLGLTKTTTTIKFEISDTEKNTALDLILNGLERNKEKVSGTIYAKLNVASNNFDTQYLKYINEQEHGKNQLLVIEVAPRVTKEKVINTIYKEYDNLSNYHFMAIVFRDTDWETISDIAINCEFLKKEHDFQLFNRTTKQKKQELSDFLKNNKNIDFNLSLVEAVEAFFDGVSYGFQFNDLFVADNDNTKILIFQKIELDETVLPCPDCMSTLVRGNSYPRVLQKSFECQNPNCPSRSKIGRGKRYDYFSVKRNLQLKLGNKANDIDRDLAVQYRRDIFHNTDTIKQMLITCYSFAGDTVKYISAKAEHETYYYGRNVFYGGFETGKTVKPTVLQNLLKTVLDNVHVTPCKPTQSVRKDKYSIYEGDCCNILGCIPEKLSAAITSPPYYNAREYSQWPTLICYLVDMLVSAKCIFDKLEKDGVYMYNIGDIVGQDNVFVSSHMSNKRLMLGFFSMLIFKLIGFHIKENLIWDKGEVQSKRNSTDKFFPTYVRPINCYEHIFVFCKQKQKPKYSQTICVFPPVKKINSKGENTLGHTAPYPIDLVKLIIPYINDDTNYVLDPFLGSGTTVITGIKYNFKTVGIELNSTYFGLAKRRIEES